MTEPVKKKSSVRVSVDMLETIRNRLLMSKSEFSVALGYNLTAINHWLKTGLAPKTAHLAAEALMRRQANQDSCFMVCVVKGVPKVTLLDNLETMKLRGQSYLLVPN